MRWTATEIATAVGGTVAAGTDAVVDRATQDSRDADARSLFVALVAERDGHDFAAAAVTAGAPVILSSRPPEELVGLADGTAVVVVADTAAALSALGAAARDRLEGRAEVFGITGSVGKTTTKDLLAAVLATDRRTHASRRSFNNELGVPLTILDSPDDTEALVIEMGARGSGHIAALCAVGRPTVGIVTAVGLAHTSEFGSLEGVAEAKGELIEALPPAGLAVLHAPNPLVMGMADRTEARVVSFGMGGDVVAEDVTLDDELVPRFRLVSSWGSADVRLGARGVHLVDNALAVAAAVLPLGLTVEQVVAGLAEPVLSPLRMALECTTGGTRIINDAYNANPMSTEAALRSLAALPAERRIAVLGVMAELGDLGPAEHARLGRLAIDLGFELIAVASPDYLGELDPDAPARLAADLDEAHFLLLSSGPLGPDDAVLLKGSRVAGLERLGARLLD